MVRYCLVCLVGLVLASGANASWADALFEELTKDFGSVPRGPTLTHHFRLVNRTAKPVNIHNVRVSCGCTQATILKRTLQPGEESAIQVTMDTRRFSGVKTVTLFVQFDRPSWEEVRLWVQANSRDDVSVAPDMLALGLAKRGSSPQASVTITFHGNRQSRILDVHCDSNYVLTSLQPVRRPDGDLSYLLTAKLRSDAPVGKWYTDLWVRTNSTMLPRVRVPLTVEIESALSVSPMMVMLGQVKVGSQAERKVIVRGIKPFRITGVWGLDSQMVVRDSSSDSRPIHVLTVTLKAAKEGPIDRRLKIITDLKEEGEIEFLTRGTVID
jgi:hypothetical protein